MMMKVKLYLGWKRKLVLGLLLFFAVVSLVLGIVFNVIFDALIDKILREKLELRNGSYAYKLWIKPPVPVAFNIYVFDVVNREEVEQGLAQPFVVERGPYVYRMHLKKVDVVRHDFNSTISFRQPESFNFDREASVGPESDTFTTINIPYFTIASTLKDKPSYMQTAAYLLMESMNEKPFINLTVYDIFWGYKDPVLELAYKLLKEFGIHMPFLTGEFGFFSGKNNTDDGLYNVFSGIDGNYKRYNLIDRWNGLKYQDLWTTRKSNAIGGSDGSLFPPYVSSNSNLSMYDGYLRRVLHLEYKKKASFKGIDGFKFVVPFSDFANVTENPQNLGFCTPNKKHCLPSGVYNFSKASYGSPSYISMPHFCGGDPYYLERVKGLQPDPEKHQPFYTVQPLTGVSIHAARRYQINIRTESLEHFPNLKNFPLAYLPIIWIDGIASLDDKHTTVFRDELQVLLDALPYMRMSLFLFFAIFLLIACFLIFWWIRKDKKKDVQADTLLKNEHINYDSVSQTSPKSGSSSGIRPVIA